MSAEEPRRRNESTLEVLRRFSALWGFLLFLLALIIVFRHIVIPFIFAILVAYILAPLIDRMEPKVGRGGAVALTYVLIIAVLAIFVGVLLPAVSKDLARLRDGAPELINRFNKEWLPRGEAWLERNFGELMQADGEEEPSPGPEDEPHRTGLALKTLGNGSQVVDLQDFKLHIYEHREGGWIVEPERVLSHKALPRFDLREIIANKGGEMTLLFGEWLRSAITGIAQFLTHFVLTFMVAAFILIDIRKVSQFLRSLVPIDFRPAFDEIMEGIDQGMSGVLRGQALICLVNGALTYLGMLIVGVKYSLLLGILATVMSLVPIFGTIISSIPIIVIALLSAEEGVAMGKATAILAWIAGIHLVEANYLNPKILGGSAHMHPVIVVFALLAGEHAHGLTGALLAVPVASVIQTVFMFARRNASTFSGGGFSSVAMRRDALGVDPEFERRLQESTGLDGGASWTETSQRGTSGHKVGGASAGGAVRETSGDEEETRDRSPGADP